MSESHEIEVYVRFCETDALGHVNNTSYFFYLEEARSKFFENLTADEDKSETPLNFIVASVKCDYISQAYAKQNLKVFTDVTHIGRKSFTLTQTIKESESKELITKSPVVIVCYNRHLKKTVEIPEFLRKKLGNKKVD